MRRRGARDETLAATPSIDDLIEQAVERIVEAKLAGLRGASRTRLVDLATVGPPKRLMYREARTGKIDGAVKIGRDWFATEEATAKWVAGHAKHVASKHSRSEPSSNLDALRSRLGLVRVG